MEIGCDRDGMSASAVGGESTVEPDSCRSAEQYVLESLEASTAARSPKELAQGYGCSADHTRNVMSELAQEGRIKRVETGLYTSLDSSEPAVPSESEADHDLSDAPEGGDTDGSEDETDADSDGEVTDRPEIADDERAELGGVDDGGAGGDDDGDAGGDDDGISAGTALVGATIGLGVIVLLSGRSSSSASDESEAVDEAEDEDQGDGDGEAAGPEVWG